MAKKQKVTSSEEIKRQAVLILTQEFKKLNLQPKEAIEATSEFLANMIVGLQMVNYDQDLTPIVEQLFSDLRNNTIETLARVRKDMQEKYGDGAGE